MTTCPFCQVVADLESDSTLLRSDLAVALLDIQPIRPGHALVIPRRHEPDFLSLSTEEQLQVLSLAKQVAAAQRKLFSPPKVGLLVAGFDVPHAHLHVVPMHEYHDLTSRAMLDKTLKRASHEDLAATRIAYAQCFRQEA